MTSAMTWLEARGGFVLAGFALFYVTLGMFVLDPEAFFSGDIGVMYAQARALADHHFTSLDIPYPAVFLDPDRTFFPMRPPFVLETSGATQAIFSPASAVVQAVAVAVAGLRGLILLSVAGGVVTLWAARMLSPAPYGTAAAIALGLGTPLWFHATAGWQHAPAVACGTAGFVLAVRSRGRAAPLIAGLLVGAGAILRDEVLLLVPGLLVALWWGTRRAGSLAAAVAGALIPLAVAASVDVWWFERPAAAHLRHAVNLLESAMRVTGGPEVDVPVLPTFTLRERYDTVVEYWLLGYGADSIIAAAAAGLVVALVISRRWRSSLGLLVWLTVVLALAAADLWEVATAPKWLAGLHRVSPYLGFALFPLPAGAGQSDRPQWLRTAIAFTAGAYLLAALAVVDTAGGKGLGPRLLLPLFPLLAVSAIVAIGAYVRSTVVAERWVGRAGVALVGIAIAIHLFGTIPAYEQRNEDDDSVAIKAVADTGERLDRHRERVHGTDAAAAVPPPDDPAGRHPRASADARCASGRAAAEHADPGDPPVRRPRRSRALQVHTERAGMDGPQSSTRAVMQSLSQ